MVKVYTHIREEDPEVFNAMKNELQRQQNKLEMIASENFVSESVLEALGSVLTNKYAEGYPGKRYYGGCEFVDVVEELAINRVKAIYGAEHANVQPHSGAQANIAVYFALLEPGDKILGMDLAHGGHLTHGMKINYSGKYLEAHGYQVDRETMQIDYDLLMKRALEVRPKMIIAGASAYPRAIDFKKFREVADAVGAYLMVDMAHIAGLVAAGLHMNPVPYADVVTSTTHKTLRGPRGGLILCREEHAKKINSAVFPGMQGGPLMHAIAGKAVAFGQAMKPEFKAYQTQVVANAKALADGLMKRGINLCSNGTDNHLILINLTGTGITGKELQERLDDLNITSNKNGIPYDELKPTVTSGVRMGTAALTSRGMKETEMDEIAELIKLGAFHYETEHDNILARVKNLTERFPLYANFEV